VTLRRRLINRGEDERRLLRRRQRRWGSPPSMGTKPSVEADCANAVWCIDYKGHFRTARTRGPRVGVPPVRLARAHPQRQRLVVHLDRYRGAGFALARVEARGLRAVRFDGRLRDECLDTNFIRWCRARPPCLRR